MMSDVSQFPPAHPPRRTPKAKAREPKAVRTHVFIPSGRFAPSAKVDKASQEICARCSSVKFFRVHDLPDTSDARVLTSRMIGEGSEE